MSKRIPSDMHMSKRIETVMGAQWYDGNISIPGCDKNVTVNHWDGNGRLWQCFSVLSYIICNGLSQIVQVGHFSVCRVPFVFFLSFIFPAMLLWCRATLAINLGVRYLDCIKLSQPF